MATKKKMQYDYWPKVVRGTHLTVTTHKDGRVELEWDDEALLREIRTALAVHSTKQKSKHQEKYGVKPKGNY